LLLEAAGHWWWQDLNHDMFRGEEKLSLKFGHYFKMGLMMISSKFCFCLCVLFVFVSFYAKNVNAIEKMSRSDYLLWFACSIESGRICQHILIWFNYLEVKWLLEDFKTMATLERSSPRTAVLSQIVFEWIWWWSVFCFCCLLNLFDFMALYLKFGQISYLWVGGGTSEFRGGAVD